MQLFTSFTAEERGSPIMKENKHMSKRKKRRLILVAIGALLLLYTWGWKVYYDINHTTDSIYSEVRTNDKRGGDFADINASEPISFALLGVDNGAYNRKDVPGRSDAILVGTINPKTKKTTLVSIPRDTYALMEGYETTWGGDYYDKLTHAYAFGGAEMTIDSIQELLNIPIDYYVEVNMQGLMDVVDAIGGIKVKSPLTFEYQDHYFIKNQTRKIDGTEALAFSRMRKEDPEGDFGRQKRQKIVIEAIIDKVLSFSTLTRYQSVLKTMQDNVKTNVTFKEMGDLVAGYRNALGNIEEDNLIGEELWLDEVYYLYTHPSDRVEIANELRQELELDSIEVADLYLSETDYYYLSDSYYEEESYYQESYYEEESYDDTIYEEPEVYYEEESAF